ncbi:putative shikimate O-hydroxycinnamoyltransferase [Helianthus anomalus]
MTMSSTPVKLISECFIKPLDDLSSEAKQPIHFTPFELAWINVKYGQRGLLFRKPPSPDYFSITTFLNHLQHSLSATLTQFYPLAARFTTRKQENPPSYVSTWIQKTPLAPSLFMPRRAPQYPTLVTHLTYLYLSIRCLILTQPFLMMVTELVDGIFIGCSVNHMVADETSLWHFMATWSEIFRSEGQSISRPPVLKRWVLDGYDLVINIPYNHQDQFIERLEIQTFKERFFKFSSTAISKLKATANSECNTHKISSLQVVIALLWRCITRARCLPHDHETTCSLMLLL